MLQAVCYHLQASYSESIRRRWTAKPREEESERGQKDVCGAGEFGKGEEEEEYADDDGERVGASDVVHPIGFAEEIADRFPIFDDRDARSHAKKS